MAFRFAVFTAYSFLFSVFISVAHGCPKGYYGSPCTVCPVNTYKDFTGYAVSCTACPTNSGHSLLGRISIQNCKCFTGYKGQPDIGRPCQIRRCEHLALPVNAAFVGTCRTEYSSLCRMQCLEGYEAVGSVVRQCIVHHNDFMMWSGTPMHCPAIRCPALNVRDADPPYGVCMSGSSPASDLVYGTRCTFTCLTGYRLTGSKERTCQLDASWSGTSTNCEEITCPKLPPIQAGASISPPPCATGPMRFHSACHFRCPFGFSIQQHRSLASVDLICQVDGTWRGSIPKCRDIEAPQLKCPNRLETNTPKGKATAKVIWSIRVTDNSFSVDPNAVIQVRSNHESGQQLPIGRTYIRITATDRAGNAATCSFDVEVKDIEPPSCSFCPSDIVQEATTNHVRVNWKRPNCSDNSAFPPSITASRQSGHMFSVPGSYQVQYTVSDGVNEYKGCSFRITLKVKTCSRFSPPRNGALVCTTHAHDFPVCAVFCKSGTDFEFNPPMIYYCSAGKWEFYSFFGPGENRTPWPNCSGRANPSWIKMHGFPWYYYSGDANKPNVQGVIQSQFHDLLVKSRLVPPIFCAPVAQCTKDSFSVSPGVIG